MSAFINFFSSFTAAFVLLMRAGTSVSRVTTTASLSVAAACVRVAVEYAWVIAAARTTGVAPKNPAVVPLCASGPVIAPEGVGQS